MQHQKLDPNTIHDTPANVSDLLNLHEIVAKARQNLNQNDWDYIVGGAESETTLRRNRMALETLAFRPRILRDVSNVDASTHQFGRKLRLPLIFAPVGSLESFHPAGAASVVKAAKEFGVGHMLSSVCDPGLEELAEIAPEAVRLYQLYVRGDADWVDDHVERAIKHGYAAFALTVDTAHYSRRERDIAKRFVTAGRRRVQNRKFQAGLDWGTVKRIKDKFNIPLAIKGIATAEDARIAVEHGVDWVYVSNHGGRQLDHGRGSVDVLPEVADAVARARQGHRRRLDLPRLRHRQGDRVRRRSRRHGAHAVLRARRRGRSRCAAAARTAGGRSAAVDGPARRQQARRSQPLVPARSGAGAAAACAERVQSAETGRLSVLTRQPRVAMRH